GGTGVLLAAILKAYPTLHGVLYDLPHVIDSARPVLEAAGGAQRCATVSGDFFVSVPEGDAYVLSRILVVSLNCRDGSLDWLKHVVECMQFIRKGSWRPIRQ